VCLLSTTTAQSGEATLTWEPSTQLTDGSSYYDRSAYKIYYGLAPSNLDQIIVTGANSTSQVVSGLAPGSWYFGISAISNSHGESALSGIVSLTLQAPLPTPLAPQGLTIKANTVYTLVKRVDGFLLIPAGTVPLGTPCDGTQQVNGFYVVPRSKVAWLGSVKPDVVVAKCD
jgi:hypothetical protein